MSIRGEGTHFSNMSYSILLHSNNRTTPEVSVSLVCYNASPLRFIISVRFIQCSVANQQSKKRRKYHGAEFKVSSHKYFHC